MNAENTARFEVNDRPLISFCLFAYNQERFIREAVEGAFSQTYSPLEIVLSDDCSTDETFEIIQEMAASYHGRHNIILNRNPRNLGIGDHVNRVMEIARGGLVVAAAGDDISYPQRTRSIHDEWQKQNRKPTSIHSDYRVINVKGEEVQENHPRYSFAGRRSKGTRDIGEFVQGKHPASHINGATHAWSRQLFRDIGPLKQNALFEDKVIALRSLIVGEFAYVPEKLISYRMRSNRAVERPNGRMARILHIRKSLLQESVDSLRWLTVMNNIRADVIDCWCRGLLPEKDREAALREIHHCAMVKKCEWEVCSAPPLMALLWFIRRLVLRPERAYAPHALKQWLLRSADHIGLL